jgi:hypothetical protein
MASTERTAVERLPKKAEIEQLIVAEMHGFTDCANALGVVVVPVMGHDRIATWTVSSFNPAKSDAEACDGALQLIVPRFQRAYDIVQRH